MHEVRCIVLDEIELFQALVEFHRFRRQPLPAGQVDHIVLTEDDVSVTACFTIRDDHGTETAITVAETELAAMVIRYLMERKVPLASQMQKQLIVVEDQLTLVLHDAKQPFRHGLGRKRATGKAPP